MLPLNTDKHSKGATLGQYLSGTATFAKEDAGKKVDVYNFKYILQEGSKKKEKEKDKGKKKAEDAAAYEEALRDCKISWLSKLGSQDLYSELLKAGGESSVITSIHAAKLANMLAVDAAEKKWKEIVDQAETVIQSVDQSVLLAWLGMKADTRENAGELKKEMEKVKGQLIEAFPEPRPCGESLEAGCEAAGGQAEQGVGGHCARLGQPAGVDPCDQGLGARQTGKVPSRLPAFLACDD